ncbi:TetR family transcriptional regulator [Nocardioides sp. LMS-CY]|uniref:AcrR family transcriptional regulator n=1 Tax=Nocardioides soli TaxID=1036020 RepID=A0A7W4Z297_9ACTN|nr:TetR/AcrR family transcriptional regulator [Nocardioides sp. LMS-CY]MBB3042661.1 AcrR family transcriptional regulator [Nocardioides soli]QWF22781.1 TetR family transcriptional regulator [Nocardioides sp. LMS-CY]
MSTTRRRSTGSPTGVARKELILRSAAKVFAEKGFSSATVRDIADEADMLSGSLYYYFDSKEAMVEEVLVEYLDRMVRAYGIAVADAKGSTDGLERLIAQALRGLVDNREHVTILQNDWHYVRLMKGIVDRQHQIEKVWLDTIQKGIDAGVIRSDIDARMMYRTIMGAIQAVIRWFNPRGRVSIDQVITIQTAILVDGIRAAA